MTQTKKPQEKKKGLAKYRNMEQVNAMKKKYTGFLIVGIVVFLVGAIIAAFFKGALQTVFFVVGFAGGALALFSVFMLKAAKKLKQKFADLECPKCHTRIEYSPNVKYTVLNTDFKVNVSSSDADKGVNIKIEGTEYKDMEIVCKCQKCGTEKKFNHQFRSATCRKTENTSRIEAGATKIRLENELKEIRANGYKSNYGFYANSTPESMLVHDYFGDIIQM